MSLVFINCTSETFTPTKSGAISTWVWEICRAAQKEGIEPWVISRSMPGVPPHAWRNTVLLDYPWIPQVRGTGIGRLLQMQKKMSGWCHVRQGAYARKVVNAIKSRGLEKFPMLLHNDPEMAVYLRAAFPAARIVHLFHNTNGCAEKYRTQFARAVNVPMGVSNYISRWQEEYFGMEANAARTVYNGIDLEKFAPLAEEPEGLPVINFVGRTDHSKAPDLLLRAARKVAQRNRNFSVQILGARFYWGSEPDDYQRLLDGLCQDLENDGVTVRRPGVVSRHDMVRELQKAHIHVVPSRWDEPCALTIFEGMAVGLPVVASRTGGTPEVVADAGLLFERDGEEELAGHLEALVSDREMRREYGSRARARVEKFSWDETWKKIRGAMLN